MGRAILTRDKAGVLSVFDLQGQPVFSLWETREAPSFSCIDDRPAERRKMLEHYLDVIKDSGTTADYTIKFHEDDDKRVTNKTPVIGSLSFKLNNEMGMEGIGSVRGGNSNMMDQLFSAKMDLMEERYKRLMEDQQREHDDELDELEEKTTGRKKKLGALGMIGEAGNDYPWMQDIIKEGINMLKDFVTVSKHKMRSNPAQHEGGIAGVETDAPPVDTNGKITAAQNKLMAWFANEYGDMDSKEGRAKGAAEYANVLTMLANLTADDDMMKLAIKKLKQLE